MRVLVNGLEISNLQKAEDDKLINVDIVANHLTEDSEGETVLKEAFSEDAVNEFLNIGCVEFWHDSRNSNLSKEEQNAAIMGKPIAFRWDNGKPVVTAQLTKSHPRVQEMLPHLEANQPVYAASIGGSKVVMEVKDPDGRVHKIIPKIKWDHLAIAPSHRVINRSGGMNVSLLRKANDILCEFDTVSSFNTNISHVSANEQELKKAMTAPSSVADTSSTRGGVITKQSLEGDDKKRFMTEDDGMDLIDTMIKIKEKKISTNKNNYMKYFKEQNKEDFGRKSYDLINKYFKKRSN